MIVKIQRVLRKAMKDYKIQANVGEETLIAFISVDILREVASIETSSQLKLKKIQEEVSRG